MAKVAVIPPIEPLERSVVAGGGTIAAPEDADAIVWADPSNPDKLREILETSPARWVQLPFAGIEGFIAAGAVDPSRTWTCAKVIYGDACAELALGLILTGARIIHKHARERHWWGREAVHGHRRVAGSTAVIVGTGGIGRSLARMLAPLDVRVIGVNRSGSAMPGAERTVPVSRLHDVLGEADWLVLAAAMTPETHHLIDAAALERLSPRCWIVNVARGPMVDTDALVAALQAGALAGAALDVTDPEPLPDGHPLWSMDNVIITSHTANTVEMAIPDLTALVERNVAHFAKGEPLEGLVDTALGY